MSWQRRRGEAIRFFREKKVQDRRGNDILEPDPESVWETRCATVFEESAQAEMAGQLSMLTLRVMVPWRPEFRGVTIWSLAEFRGEWWDVHRMPALRTGRGPVRHATLWLRRRPGVGGWQTGGFPEDV